MAFLAKLQKFNDNCSLSQKLFQKLEAGEKDQSEEEISAFRECCLIPNDCYTKVSYSRDAVKRKLSRFKRNYLNSITEKTIKNKFN